MKTRSSRLAFFVHATSATFTVVLFAPARDASAQTAPSIAVGAPAPNAIDRDGCEHDVVVDVPFEYAAQGGDQLFVWAGLGDCMSAAARMPGTPTATCWQVLPAPIALDPRGGRMIIRLGAQQIVGQLNVPPPYSVAYAAPSPAACQIGPGTAVTGTGVENLQLTFVVANGPEVPADAALSTTIAVHLAPPRER